MSRSALACAFRGEIAECGVGRICPTALALISCQTVSAGEASNMDAAGDDLTSGHPR